MSCIVSIGPVSDNKETELKLAFGENVSTHRVIEYVKRNTQMREDCGMISNIEGLEMIKQAEEKLKELKLKS